MTYGQTVGLTHDAPLVGNAAACAWGFLGLFLKGGLWIGFAGAFLGLGFGAKRYRPSEMTLVMLALLGLFFLGVWLINSPFDPAHRVLPPIYFSDDWRWQPGAELKPRPEIWGGMLLALAGLVAYVQLARRDGFARNMALVGFLAGGLGFSLGQSVQALHAWHPEVFKSLLGEGLYPHVNWWNMMEISFGAIFGGVLALGLWLNRRGIALAETSRRTRSRCRPSGNSSCSRRSSPSWSAPSSGRSDPRGVHRDRAGDRRAAVGGDPGRPVRTLPVRVSDRRRDDRRQDAPRDGVRHIPRCPSPPDGSCWW